MKSQIKNEVERKFVAEYRAAHPRSRIQSILKFVRNGSGSKQMGCVLCGWVGPTWCGSERKTLRAVRAEVAHLAEHGIVKVIS